MNITVRKVSFNSHSRDREPEGLFYLMSLRPMNSSPGRTRRVEEQNSIPVEPNLRQNNPLEECLDMKPVLSTGSKPSTHVHFIPSLIFDILN